LLSALDALLSRMTLAVVGELRVPLEEVRSWAWGRLRDAYADVARLRHEQQMAQISAATIGTARAIGATLGGKTPEPLPTFDDTYRDPFKARPHAKQRGPSLLDKVIQANMPVADAEDTE
jgi:hypothetical protein